MISESGTHEVQDELLVPSSSHNHDSRGAPQSHLGDIYTLASHSEACVDVANSQEHVNMYRTESITEGCSFSISTNATESNRPGPGRALDNLFQAGGRGLERLLYRVVKVYRSGKNADKPAGSNAMSLVLQRDTDEVSDNATMSNLPGPGRLLDKFYQSSGRELEKSLGKLADRAGFGPAAAERSVRDEIMRCYEQLLEVRDVELSQQKFDWIRLPGAEATVRKACRKLLRYTQSETPSTQLIALRSIQSLVALSPFLKECFIMEQAGILLHTLPKLLSTRNAAQIFYSDPEYDQLLSASRRALRSVEDNEINKLAKQLSRHLTRRVDWTLLEGWNRLGPAFLAYLRHPDYAFLAARYLESSLKILRYNFGAAGPDSTNLQVALFNIIAGIMSSNFDLSITFEHSVLETIVEDVLVIAWKCAIEYSRVGREHESLEYERFALWLEDTASKRGFCPTCEVETESVYKTSQGDDTFTVRLSSPTYKFTGDARRHFAKRQALGLVFSTTIGGWLTRAFRRHLDLHGLQHHFRPATVILEFNIVQDSFQAVCSDATQFAPNPAKSLVCKFFFEAFEDARSHVDSCFSAEYVVKGVQSQPELSIRNPL